MTGALYAQVATQSELYYHVDASNTIGVAYDDLNLASAQGVARLDSRLRRAAEQVCDAESTKDLAGQMRARTCRAKAIAAPREARELAIAGMPARMATR